MKEIEKITSRDNPRLVNVRKVRDGKVPERVFIEGRRLVEEALRSAIAINAGSTPYEVSVRATLDAIASVQAGLC